MDRILEFLLELTSDALNAIYNFLFDTCFPTINNFVSALGSKVFSMSFSEIILFAIGLPILLMIIRLAISIIRG